MVKQGYIRTLEAVIAIVIILLFIFTITPKNITNPSEIPVQVKTAQTYILQSIAEDGSGLRDEILAANIPDSPDDSGYAENPGYINCDDAQVPAIQERVSDNIPPGFDHSCAVCLTTNCVFTPAGVTTSVYVDDIMIAPPDTITPPKIVRIWMWQIV